jgi:hypothetical protein
LWVNGLLEISQSGGFFFWWQKIVTWLQKKRGGGLPLAKKHFFGEKKAYHILKGEKK